MSFPFEAPLIPALKKRFEDAEWNREKKQWFLPYPASEVLAWINYIGARLAK